MEQRLFAEHRNRTGYLWVMSPAWYSSSTRPRKCCQLDLHQHRCRTRTVLYYLSYGSVLQYRVRVLPPSLGLERPRTSLEVQRDVWPDVARAGGRFTESAYLQSAIPEGLEPSTGGSEPLGQIHWRDHVPGTLPGRRCFEANLTRAASSMCREGGTRTPAPSVPSRVL